MQEFLPRKLVILSSVEKTYSAVREGLAALTKPSVYSV
jgi:hypothetical protein